MNQHIINLNIINKINNQELYEPNLMDFLLNNSDLKQLKSELYSCYSSGGVYFKSNFEGFLFIKFHDKECEMKSKIYQYFGDKLEEPKYFVDLDSKSHNNILSKRAFLLFKNGINSYLSNVNMGKEDPLDNNEEKFLINYILNKDLLVSLSEESKKEIYKILCNQKEYLQFKNSKSQKNIFLQNENLKKILDLFSNHEVDFIIGKTTSCEDLVNIYFKKLHRSKVFDLHVKLKEKNSIEVYQAMESVLGSYSNLNWFNSLIKQGTNCGLEFFEKLYKEEQIENINKLSNYLRPGERISRKPKAIKEMLNLIALTKDVSDLSKNQNDIAKLFLIVIYSNHEQDYLKLRSIFEIPEQMHSSFMNLKIGNKTVKELECEVLKENLEKDLAKNNIKTRKIKL